MICKCCSSDKNKAFFSKAQLKKKINERKCIDCCEKESSLFTLEKQKVLFYNLIKWLRDNNATFPNLEIKHYNENFRGMVTTKNVYKGKPLISIPQKCIMTSLKAYESESGKELKNSGWEPHSSHTWLALYLLEEKQNSNSFWKPYIDIIPPIYGDFPQFYRKAELSQLKGSFVLDMIRSRNLNLEKEFNDLIKAIPVFGKKISLRDYVWARIAIVSRVFQITYSDTKTTQGLVPIADMLNHSKTPSANWMFSTNDDAFIVATNKFTSKGIEVTDSYGPKCNSRYLVNYGFTLSDNQVNNQAAIFIDPNILAKDDNFKSSKLQLFNGRETTVDDSYSEYLFLVKNKMETGETNISKNGKYRFQFVMLQDIPVQTNLKEIREKSFTGLHSLWAMFGFLRTLLSNEDEFKEITSEIIERAGGDKLNILEVMLQVKPFDAETEVAVLKTLSQHCEKMLDGFSSTIEMDEYELKTTEPFSNRWNILNLLIGEKKTLLYYRELGVFVNKMWEETKSVHKVGRFLRKHPEFSTYYSVYWSKLNTNT